MSAMAEAFSSGQGRVGSPLTGGSGTQEPTKTLPLTQEVATDRTAGALQESPGPL